MAPVGALLTARSRAPSGFIAAISVWLWFTVLFANFAEALAEGRGKAQAASLRGAKKDTPAMRLDGTRRDAAAQHRQLERSCARATWCWSKPASSIPGDGEVIEGVASVDEIGDHRRVGAGHPRGGGDRSSVTGGTRVLSDWLVVRITANPGEAFLDRMIAMVEGAKRQRTPNEIALVDPARGADARVPDRRGDAAAVLASTRSPRRSRAPVIARPCWSRCSCA